VFTTRSQIQEALSRVGRRLALADAGEYALLICGGSALNLAGLVDRPTRDVDVLGLVKGTEKVLVVAELLPEEVLRAAQWVAADLKLPDDWLNDSAFAIHRLGLPAGILKRAHRHEFGPCLTVYVIGRQDQVALKLYAALDRQKGRRHLQDLDAIDPTLAEMEFAVHWLLDRKTSPEFRRAVRKISEALGFRKLPALISPESEPRSPSTARTNPGKRMRRHTASRRSRS
jgi:hypothetical protein